MKLHHLYIAVIGTVFLALAVVFDTLPRSTISVLEKRDLAVFPDFSVERLKDGSFTRDVSTWFSDSEPFRDDFMALSMQLQDAMRVKFSDDNITFHASETTETSETDAASDDGAENRDAAPYKNRVNANENAKIASAGIVVTGSGKNVRAFMIFGGSPKGGTGYSKAANRYKSELGSGVNVYCMVIPTAMEFYCPDKIKSQTREERLTINNIYEHLAPDVKSVDIYTPLAQHADEDIYLRTDHHWAPLGAYYAAQKFAEVAKVPFKDLEAYEKRIVKGYVGTMYGYSKDIAVKNAPEDFVYYVPQDITYKTTYINYTLNEDYQIVGESKPFESVFFFKYRDGASGAYCTFMGGDMKITKVQTGTKNGRRLLIVKDSFGNAIPGYLFYSFEEIHVVDFRYFNKNLKAYVHNNHVTDVLLACNIFNAYSDHTSEKIANLLNGYHPAPPKPKKQEEAKSRHTEKPLPQHSESHDSEPRHATDAEPAEKHEQTTKPEEPKAVQPTTTEQAP